ncbi:YobI family P-loop NTPase [Flavobacterium cucumis]|uniref:YobI-like P-loop NTPase domain-containing protein n=2 Tax=Flavobacterium cucumis TaxID=416016 RepID=A0A1M7ZYT0_9FLAO|nr:hypothetical protein [Flavobacterium cucumis]SHO74021.1 hypothetical protein SAMN05443547_2401 [Flavobacterium cucumis]
MRRINNKDLLPVWLSINRKESIEIASSISSLAPKVLTKKEDLEKIQPYLDKLKDTIDTKGVNNIALTGGYGSGKSTIINTFKSLNSQYEYLNISLASFNKKKEEKNNKLTLEQKKIQRDELERLLEVSILQQIFYHVKPSEIPESRFKRIINIPDWKIWTISFTFILWISSSILLLKYNYLDKINPINWSNTKNFDWFALLILIIAFSGLGLLSKLVVKLFSNSQINKVNIKGELELGNNVNKSVFNEHLEEILYFFERTNFNVVIIEDLDRFDSTDIFTKLREINILLNNSQLIKQEINFIYAVGDALFNDKKERVKFFEYIIPVIPFINSSNAQEQLMNLIKESELEDNILSSEFLSDITTFIDDIDMRLLINIFHEFAIYRNVLKPDLIKGSEAELFAIITYKNLYPKDYDALNSNKGKLFELINNKKKYIEDYVCEIEEDIKNKGFQINEIESETISNIRELRSIYTNLVLSKIPHEALVLNINIQELDEEEFNKIINNNVEYVTYNHYNGHYYTRSAVQKLKYSFASIEKEINSNYSFKDRIGLIESKNSNKINLLKNEIEALRKKKIEIESWDLKKIFKEVSIDNYLTDFVNSGLIRNLLLEGHLNENYSDFISLFHEVSLTKEDKKFERSVKSGINEEFDYKLTQIENLIENQIDLRYFNRESILNFDLINFLGENYNKYSDKYDALIDLLSNEKVRSIDFIDRYISLENIPIKIFFEKLVKNWLGFWDYISLKSNYLPEKQYKYLSLIIMFGLIDDILSSQNNNTLASSINQKAHFLSLIKNTEELNYLNKIKKLIEKLNIEFEELENPNNETKKLFDFVYENNHYKINIVNLKQMIYLYGKKEENDVFETSNYFTILNSNCVPLIDYINSNINTYIEDVYLKLDLNNYENEDALIELLNNEELEDKLKFKIIQKIETLISDISKIENFEIKKQLLINLKVIANWENVIDYYSNCDFQIDDSLVNFLNIENIYLKLSKEKMIKESETFDYPNFRKNILLCNELSIESYTKILEENLYTRGNLSFENLETNKINYLVSRILTLTKDNYDLLKKNFSNYHIALIEKDFREFLLNFDDFEIENKDILTILESKNIFNDYKIELITKLPLQVLIDDKLISRKVGEIILTASSKIKFEYNIIESIVKNTILLENKISLVNLYFNDLDDSNIITLLNNITGYDKLFQKGKPTYLKTDFNNSLFEKLMVRKLIKKYYEDKWNKSNFRITTNY